MADPIVNRVKVKPVVYGTGLTLVEDDQVCISEGGEPFSGDTDAQLVISTEVTTAPGK